MDRMRILVVDDEPFILDLIEMILLGDGHTVKAVTDGKQALQCFEDATYDVVVTDGSMPELDGLSLAKEIKARKPAQKIVLLTGSGEEERLPSNIDAVLGKPVQIDVLRDLLKRLTT